MPHHFFKAFGFFRNDRFERSTTCRRPPPPHLESRSLFALNLICQRYLSLPFYFNNFGGGLVLVAAALYCVNPS
eukprot:scaffold2351_cov84-Skeletonema_dohrnii-CCMP3373.AAC.8